MKFLMLGVAAFAAIASGRIGVEVSSAQGQPRPTLTPVANKSPIAAGKTALVTLRVKLDPQVHIQSDKPRDRLLIPTELVFRLPAGVKVESIGYPKATDLAQPGRAEPLAVFSGTFTIDARLSIATTVPPGELVIPAQLKYQACDETMCFAPARADVQWTLRVNKP